MTGRFKFCLPLLRYRTGDFGSLEMRSGIPGIVHLGGPDFDFVQDGTRRDDAFRLRQHAWYLERLAPLAARVLRVGGPLESRVEAVARRLGLAR